MADIQDPDPDDLLPQLERLLRDQIARNAAVYSYPLQTFDEQTSSAIRAWIDVRRELSESDPEIAAQPQAAEMLADAIEHSLKAHADALSESVLAAAPADMP